MRASRLLSILILLQMRGRLSADSLAREFEVSVRTIYRDIDHLSAAGVPVYAERGRAGGFALLDGYRTRLTGLTPAEADALMFAGLGEAAADLGIGAAAAAAHLKLLASLPPDSGASAQRVASRFHVDPLNWYARPETIAILPSLAEAVWRDGRIRIEYESWKDVVTRDVSPLGLVLKAGIWYLVAAAKGRPRTYRVSNIRKLEMLKGQGKRPARFDLGRYWRDWTCAFEARLMNKTATIEISFAGRRLLRDVNASASEAVETKHTPTRRVDWVRADIPVEDVAQASRQLLRLGADVVVIAPPELRAAVRTEAGKVMRLYRHD